MRIYLDNSATTRQSDAVTAAVIKAVQEDYFNPSALYSPAFSAEKQVFAARKAVAASLRADEKNVIFTSGGTESDNLAVFGALEAMHAPKEILYSAAEHAAVKNACAEAAVRFGCVAHEIPLEKNGTLDLKAFEAMLTENTSLICVMQVCNETGAVMQLNEVSSLRDRLAPKAHIHVDGVQGYLRIPFYMSQTRVQSYALSGHKFHAPKGIGALVLANGGKVHRQLYGGGQQGDLRSGTENTPGILGLAEAVRTWPASGSENMRALKQELIARLRKALPETVLVGPEADSPLSAPHIISVAFPPVRAETLLHALEADEIYVGTGSACSSKKRKHSAVLAAMNCSPAVMDGAIRISLNPFITMEEIEYTCDRIIEKVTLLRQFERR